MSFQDWRRRFLSYEFYVLLIVTLGAMANQLLLLVAVALVLLFNLLRYVDSQGSWWPVVTPVDLAIFGLCVMLPLTWAITIDSATTGWQILRILNGIGLFYAVVHWLSGEVARHRLSKLIFGLEAMGILIVALGLVSTKWPIGKSRIFDQIYYYLSTFSTGSIHPNVLAGALLLLLPIPFVFFLLPFAMRYSQRKHVLAVPSFVWGGQLWHGIVTLVLFGTVLLTQSRGALLGFMAMIVVVTFSTTGKRVRVLCLGALIVFVVLGWRFPQQFSTLASQLTSDSAISTSAIRLEIWSRAYYMIQDFPFTGIGLGNFQQILEQMYPLFLTTEIIPHAHNLFLQIATDLGLLGLICWLAIVMGVTASLLAVQKRAVLHFAQPRALMPYMLATALLGSQAALLTHGIVDAVTWSSVRTAPFVWLLWGTAIALYRADRANNAALP